MCCCPTKHPWPLDATVTQLAAEPVPDLRHLHWAQNLLDLFDFFVPIVSVDDILVVVWDDTLPLWSRHISPVSISPFPIYLVF